MESIENKENSKSLSDLLGMQFKDDGTWSAKDVGQTTLYRKQNRKERRAAKAQMKKLLKKGK